MNILIVEDEQALASALATVCQRLGHTAVTCFSGQRARAELAGSQFALVILDIGLPDMNGLTLLEQVRDAKVLVITAHGNLDNALAARKLGAAGYLVKPLDLPQLETTLQQLLGPAGPLPAAVLDAGALLVGASPAMQRVFVEIAHACVSGAPVLLTGSTGTGKTLAARVIHANSTRQHGPFITLACAALPENLLESELFGHEKHAFTGAAVARAGHVDRAAGGTLFLDEIGDISPAVQAKLLRLVEEKTFTRVGGREDHTVDLRLITATHRDLRAEVKAGRFREDLVYRLRVLEIPLPALAERKEDLPVLTASLLAKLAPGRNLHLAPATIELLAQHNWPGNVRELRNVLEHAAAVCAGPVVLPQHLPRELRPIVAGNAESAALDAALANWLATRLAAGTTYDEISADLESIVLRHLLRRYNDRPSVLARELNINRATLLKRRRVLGL